MIIHGKSGYGKTSLMAKVAILAQEKLRSSVTPLLVVRFCGTSAQSSTSHSLMENISEHTSRAYQQPYEKSHDYSEVIKKFHSALEMGTTDRPLLVFIDSVDQLSDEDLGRSNLRWIPENLPPNCFLIISTLPDEGGCLQYLQNQTNIPKEDYLEVPAISQADAETIIGQWLKEKNRDLQPEQMEFLITLACSTKSDVPNPLKLKLLFDIAIHWKSYETKEHLICQMEPYMACIRKNKKIVSYTTTIENLISGFFQTLEAKHGKALVSCICGLMSSCKGGLSESHLTDIVSGDSDVMDTVLQYHNPPIRRLPQVVMSRLRNDIESYIVERGIYNMAVIAWFHRQFIERSEDIYRTRGISHLEMIAKYFSNELHDEFPNLGLERQPYYWKDLKSGSTKFNYTALVELPWALNRMNDISGTEKFVSLTCDLHFIAVCCQAGLGRDLVQNFYVAKYMPRLMYVLSDKSNEGFYKTLTDRLNGFRFFLSSNVANLQEYPFLIHQFGLNMPDEHVVYMDAKAQELTDIVPWATEKIASIATYKHLTKVQNEPPSIHTLSDDVETRNSEDALSKKLGYIMCIKINSLGSVVISGDHLGKLVIWSLQNGQALYTLNVPDELSDIAIFKERGDDRDQKFNFVASTAKGLITMWAVDIDDLKCDVEQGPVWQAHSLERADDQFEHVPIAVMYDSTEYISTYIITSGTQSWTTEVEELCVWEFSGRGGMLPKEVDKLPVKESGKLLGDPEYRESYRLFQTCNEEYLCVAVDQRHSETWQQAHSRVALVTVSFFDKHSTFGTLFVSEPLTKQPKSLSLYVYDNQDPSYALQVAVTFKWQKIFNVLEIKRVNDVKYQFEGKVIFKSKEHGKEPDTVLMIDKDHVLFNEGASLVNLNLKSKQYKFQGRASSTYLPGHVNSIYNMEPLKSIQNDMEPRSRHTEKHGIICTADRRSIKALDLKKLLEFQSLPINDRRLHPGPVRAMAGTTGIDAPIVVTWASRDGHTGQAEVTFWDARINTSLNITPFNEAIENTLIHEGGSRGNINIALSADGKTFCYMDCYQLTLRFFRTENIRSVSEPTLLENLDLKGNIVEWIDDILSLTNDGSKLLVAGCCPNGAYLIDIPDDDGDYTVSELPFPGMQLWGGRISPDGQYSIILSAEISLSDSDSHVRFAPYMKLFDSDTCKELAEYKADLVKTLIPKEDLSNKSYIIKPKCSLTSVDFLPDGKHLVTASDRGKLMTFSVPDLIHQREVDAHKKPITCVRTVMHKDVFYIVSGSKDGWVKLWRFPDLSLVAMHDNAAEVTCVSACSNQALMTDGDVIFIQYGDPDGRLEILEVHVQ